LLYICVPLYLHYILNSVFTVVLYVMRWTKQDLTCIYFKEFLNQFNLLYIFAYVYTCNDPGTLAMGGWRGRSKQRRWGAAVWDPWHSAGRPGQTAFNRFKNQFKLIQMISKPFKLWSIEKGPSWARQIWNKIWLEHIWNKEQLSL
jgi:hypothetical protein